MVVHQQTLYDGEYVAKGKYSLENMSGLLNHVVREGELRLCNGGPLEYFGWSKGKCLEAHLEYSFEGNLVVLFENRRQGYCGQRGFARLVVQGGDGQSDRVSAVSRYLEMLIEEERYT